jgi:hypothetical protein
LICGYRRLKLAQRAGRELAEYLARIALRDLRADAALLQFLGQCI